MSADERPLVSVIIPVYNEETYLRQTLESLAKQSYSPIELIIVDDNSTDSSIQVARTALDDLRFSRSKLLHNRANMGATFSKNRGAVAASGDYIVFHDGDDLSTPDRFKDQVAFLENHSDVGVVGSAVFYVEERSGERTVRVRPTDDTTLRATAARECPVNIGSAMFRATALYATRLLRSEYVEGYELVILIAENWKLANLSEPMYVYRINAGSRSREREISKKIVLIKRSFQAAHKLNLGYSDPFLSFGWLVYTLLPKIAKRNVRRIFSPTSDRQLTAKQRKVLEDLL